jgi:hypothetical protein
MATATLNLHAGGDIVTRDDLLGCETPPATDTWHPIPHVQVLDTTLSTLESAGFQVTGTKLSLSHEGARFFAVVDLATQILEGVSLACGIRNSCDKTFPIGFCAGNRVFVCSNLAMTSEIVIAKRHTKFGEERYREGIAQAVSKLGLYKEAQARWIGQLQARQITREESDSILLRSYEENLIGARQLPLLISEVRNPPEGFKEPTAWNLWNHFTAVIGRTTQAHQPAKAALTTIKLQRLFSGKDVIDVEFTRSGERQFATAT